MNDEILKFCQVQILFCITPGSWQECIQVEWERIHQITVHWTCGTWDARLVSIVDIELHTIMSVLQSGIMGAWQTNARCKKENMANVL